MEDKIIKVDNDYTCPVCGSTAIEGGSVDFETNGVYQSCICADCGSGFVFGYEIRDAYITCDGRNE